MIAKLDAEGGLQGRTRATERATLWRVQDVLVRAHRVHGMFSGVSGRASFGQWRARFESTMVLACSGKCRQAC
jgi:hypothetical protein